MTSPNPPHSASHALGWLLAVPALLGTLITLVLPTGQTIWLSFQRGGVLRESTYAGTANYAELLGGGEFWRAVGFTLSLTLIPLLVAVVVGPLLALALDRAGTWPRRAARIALSLAVVTFSPVGVAAAWTRGLMPNASGVVTLADGLREATTAPGTLRLIVAAATFGVVCALALVAYLPVLRGGTPGPALLAVGALLALGVVAVGLQAFSFGMVLTRGGPQRATETLAGLSYDYAFRMAEFGPGAAVAALTWALLAVLGVAATIVAVAFRLRITLTPREAAADASSWASHDKAPSPYGVSSGAAAQLPASPYGEAYGQPAAGPYGVFSATGQDAPASPYVTGGAELLPAGPAKAVAGAGHASSAVPVRRAAGPVAVAAGVTALVVVAAVALLCAWPWIDGALASPRSPAGTLRAQVNTWVPALAGAVVSVGVAYLAALGIGGLRPLGRRSEWLLLVFAPWLFAGTGVLGVANWQNTRNLGLVDTFPALIPPVLVSVPALLVLTLLCKGLAERTDRDFFGGVFLPSLPMAGILTGAVTLVNAHDLLWPLLVAQQPELFTAPVAQVNQLSSYAARTPDVGAGTPLLVVAVALAALVAAQLLYLDRLAITAKDGGQGSPSPAPAA
ncbi:sugar ABC transporter permease [Nonomuraea terrae]|uniref:Sugar ABC transporter permease n=1 Tax=Nonomuraea terrae TaxID=2530383 RepID=A0A4R4XJN5_9ACTN|nr:sugar ABC transporter permease [Nonomuraea terrae]TDD31146.1 sugar ABC transporter permease [Nonomuraea terrae]